MLREPLYVLHVAKEHAESPTPFAGLGGAFVLETCLRHVAVVRTLPEFAASSMQVFQAEEAYAFLLEMACGLHSKMKGESEIFGQLKEAWKQYQAAHPEASRPLNTLMQKLFADTKRIRTEHLHGIGGQSYAGVTQKLLGLKKTDHLLIIGAGQFGRMFATKLRKSAARITVMNRSLAPLHALQAELPTLYIETDFGKLDTAIAAADHVLICVPALPESDARILQAWGTAHKGRIIHFGCMEWAEKPENGYDLKEVMERQQQHSHLRPQKIAAAFSAVRALAEARKIRKKAA